MRIVLLIAILGLGACAPKEPKLMQAAANSVASGPDEFAISTNDPLVEPANYSTLPTPTPGAENLADLDPDTMAIEALGGRALRQGGLASGSPLLAHATRFGYDPAIRQRLASEDLEFREKNRGLFMERLFGVNVYFDSYEVMSLDQYAELARMRALGIPTPAAPPDPAK